MRPSGCGGQPDGRIARAHPCRGGVRRLDRHATQFIVIFLPVAQAPTMTSDQRPGRLHSHPNVNEVADTYQD